MTITMKTQRSAVEHTHTCTHMRTRIHTQTHTHTYKVRVYDAFPRVSQYILHRFCILFDASVFTMQADYK